MYPKKKKKIHIYEKTIFKNFFEYKKQVLTTVALTLKESFDRYDQNSYSRFITKCFRMAVIWHHTVKWAKDDPAGWKSYSLCTVRQYAFGFAVSLLLRTYK